MKKPAVILALAMLTAAAGAAQAPSAARPHTDAPQLAIFDTDIGDYMDDDFALALMLDSPEIHLLGITTAYGDTDFRARLTDRYLAAVCEEMLPVVPGVPTPHVNAPTQLAYAKQGARTGGCIVPGNLGEQTKDEKIWKNERKNHDAAGFILRKIRAYPGQITLIALGPLFNIQAAIERDPATFRKLKRVVMMGGSIARGYDTANGAHSPAEPEWNIARNPAGMKALLASGVPVYLLPLDSTQISLETAQREAIFSHGSPVTDQVTLLYHQWLTGPEGKEGAMALFDPAAAAYAIRPKLCPTVPMRLEVDEQGNTLRVAGEPNAQVCMQSDEKGFLTFFMDRLTGEAAR